MIKRRFERAFSAVRMAVAIIPLAGCDTGIERWSTKLAELLGPILSNEHETVGNLTQVAKPLSIEHRHYDIYTRYHAAFEEPSGRLLTGAREDGEDGIQTTGMSHDGAGYNEAIPACSVRMLMMQD